MLQFWSSELSPMHKLSATGDLFPSWHCLDLDWVPVPHISVHTLQSSQSAQAANEMRFFIANYYSLLKKRGELPYRYRFPCYNPLSPLDFHYCTPPDQRVFLSDLDKASTSPSSPFHRASCIRTRDQMCPKLHTWVLI